MKPARKSPRRMPSADVKPDTAVSIKRDLAALLVEVDRLQARAMLASDQPVRDDAAALGDLVCDLESMAAAIARALFPGAAGAELLAAQAGLALADPTMWRALGDVAKASGYGTAKVDEPFMSAAVLSLAYSRAAVLCLNPNHPHGTVEGDGAYLRINDDGTVAAWTSIANRYLMATVPSAAPQLRVCR